MRRIATHERRASRSLYRLRHSLGRAASRSMRRRAAYPSIANVPSLVSQADGRQTTPFSFYAHIIRHDTRR